MNWASEGQTYHHFVQMLDLPAYRFRLLQGLTYSLGGVSANLVSIKNIYFSITTKMFEVFFYVFFCTKRKIT